MPYSRKAKYIHHRRRNPKEFVANTLKTVPISHTNYSGTKFKGKKMKAIVGRLKPAFRRYKTKKQWAIQSILEPKKK